MENFVEIGKKIKANAAPSKVNVIHPFVEAQPDKKLSIVGVYDNSVIPIVNGVGEIIPYGADGFYYGLDPVFGADEICHALKNGVFDNSKSLEKFIDEHADIFTLPASMSKYARALFAKTLVKMSTMFGHKLTCEKECYERVVETVKSISTKNLDYDLNEENRVVRLLGQPSDELISALEGAFSINEQGEVALALDSTSNFREKIFSRPIEIVQGKGYYSGVLLRAKNFEWRSLDYFNAEVSSLSVKFERTTFATRDAFDSSYIKRHRLLSAYKDLLDEIDMREDALLREYFSDLSVNNDEVMARVNRFLAESYSTHHLSVSGNILTSDGYLILGKRGAKTIDAGGYYCSINGQGEVFDKNVKFYKQSVYEDMPAIRIDEELRIDFMSEFEREAEAELNVLCPAGRWSLRGISLLAIVNESGEDSARRRFHFNILGECNTEYPLSHILQMQQAATEKFENSKLVGVKISKYKNVFSWFANSVKNALMWVLKSKDFVTSVFALALFAISIGELKNTEFTIQSLSSVISVIFTALSVVVFVSNLTMAIINYSKRKDTHRRLTIVGQCHDFYSSIHKTLLNKKINLYPIADLLLYVFIKYH